VVRAGHFAAVPPGGALAGLLAVIAALTLAMFDANAKPGSVATSSARAMSSPRLDVVGQDPV
jgi:hypothetical protein